MFMSIKLLNEPFYRVRKTSRGRKDYPCHGCGTVIPKGTESFVIYLHHGTGTVRACDNCVTVYKTEKVLVHRCKNTWTCRTIDCICEPEYETRMVSVQPSDV